MSNAVDINDASFEQEVINSEQPVVGLKILFARKTS